MEYAFINLLESALEWTDPCLLFEEETPVSGPLKVPVPPCNDLDGLSPRAKRDVTLFLQVLTGVVGLSEAAERADEQDTGAIDDFCTGASAFLPAISHFEKMQLSTDAKGRLVIYYIDNEEAIKATLDKLNREMERMKQAHFFGNETLKKVCPVLSKALLVADTSPGASEGILLKKLEAFVEKAGKRLLLMYPEIVQGGYGFTKETAWVMQGEDDDVISQEYFVIDRLGLPRPERQALVNGVQVYDVFTIPVKIHGQKIKVSQYFDISKYWQQTHQENMERRSRKHKKY